MSTYVVLTNGKTYETVGIPQGASADIILLDHPGFVTIGTATSTEEAARLILEYRSRCALQIW
jgi:hypothetical protein